MCQIGAVRSEQHLDAYRRVAGIGHRLAHDSGNCSPNAGRGTCNRRTSTCADRHSHASGCELDQRGHCDERAGGHLGWCDTRSAIWTSHQGQRLQRARRAAR